MPETVLIVDDEKDLVDLVAYNLAKAGFKVERAYDGPSALRMAMERPPDLMLLDLMLPGMDGLEICKRLRSDPKGRSILILMLTAKGEETDKVVGLEVGADDYVTKPFSPKELIARVRALLRRSQTSQTQPEKSSYRFTNLELDQESHEVKVKNKPVELTAKEFKLLAYLCARPGRVLTRDLLLEQVWDVETDVETRTVDVHIHRLREKLGMAGDYIQTVRGVGYKFKAKEA